MANPSHGGIRGDPYLYCQRCGTVQRSSNMQWQLGLLVCNRNGYGCVDDLEILVRPSIIQQVLASGPDAPPADVLQQNSLGDDETEIVF